MTTHEKSAIILGAGMGTRMKSSIPKVMHKIAGRPMVNHVVYACKGADISDITVVIGPDMDDLANAVAPHKTVIQIERKGTGDAVKSARADYNGYVFILNGDAPFITPLTLNALYESAQKTGLAVLGCEFDNPFGYGRFIIDSEYVDAIVEHKDCTPDQHAINTANAGVYCVAGKHLFEWLDAVNNDNAQGEYYLTDIIAIAKSNGVRATYTLASEQETLGINDRVQLAQAERIMQDILRENAMRSGVTMIDPSTVYLSMDTQFDYDVTIEPNVCFGDGVCVGTNTHIHAYTHIEGTIIGKNTSVGPFARIRPKSKIADNVSIGNFCEVNRSEFKNGSKSKHLSYIGDAIIGEKTNIGAGTVFANYDGFNKHITTVDANAFIGSNTTIISPITIGEGAITAAGSVITNGVAPNDLAVGRSKQNNKQGWALQYRVRNKK
jgi:bifunctional UDP-N-acetylglucosamine pyrophosphorylase/glucosamine-1-phosphate N-acetyltransferase